MAVACNVGRTSIVVGSVAGILDGILLIMNRKAHRYMLKYDYSDTIFYRHAPALPNNLFFGILNGSNIINRLL